MTVQEIFKTKAVQEIETEILNLQYKRDTGTGTKRDTGTDLSPRPLLFYNCLI